jgi:periplasmic protein TonB
MNPKQTRRLLIVAFALSLLVHLLMALFARWPFERSKEQAEVVHVSVLRTTRIAHVSTPPPQTPKPAPTSSPTAAPVRAAARPHRGIGGIHAGPPRVAQAPPTPPPSPAPSPAATTNCAKGDTSAQVVASPPPPDIAPNVRGEATSGTSRIRVTIDPQGNVQNAMVVGTSGNPSLDLVALTMAKSAQYAPAMHDCKTIASDYVYSVRFVAW